ncbi:hypothetical protein [Cupriavidus sp. H39]|uniref:hypothetical protein n=1 Tax=Cupriavidus sp. H39 TaxID=3401635 RepID=UPI003CFD5AC9
MDTYAGRDRPGNADCDRGRDLRRHHSVALPWAEIVDCGSRDGHAQGWAGPGIVVTTGESMATKKRKTPPRKANGQFRKRKKR